MTDRPSLRELLGVWVLGTVLETLAHSLIDDPELVLTAPVLAGALVFFLTPAFLVVYTLVWAWPLAARGDRTAVSALVAFAVVVEALSGSFWIAAHALTLTTILMRFLAMISPMAFAACAISATLAYRRRVSPEAVAPSWIPHTPASVTSALRRAPLLSPRPKNI